MSLNGVVGSPPQLPPKVGRCELFLGLPILPPTSTPATGSGSGSGSTGVVVVVVDPDFLYCRDALIDWRPLFDEAARCRCANDVDGLFKFLFVFSVAVSGTPSWHSSTIRFLLQGLVDLPFATIAFTLLFDAESSQKWNMYARSMVQRLSNELSLLYVICLQLVAILEWRSLKQSSMHDTRPGFSGKLSQTRITEW